MADQGMSEHLRQMLASLRAAVRPWLPKRLRGGGAVVPVVRLSGAIGLSTPLRPGLTLASVARPLEKAFTTRRASAVALLINSPGGSPVQSHLIHLRIRAARGRAQGTGDRLCRGRRRVGRLHARLRRRRDHLRQIDDHRFDRRDRRLVRIFRLAGEGRHRAAALYVWRAQGDARPVPAGEARGRGTPEIRAARNSRGFHRTGEGEPGRASDRPRK